MVYMFGMYSVMVFLGPFLLLLVLNTRIGIEIHRARLRRHSIVANGKVRKISQDQTSYPQGDRPNRNRRSAASVMLTGSQRNRLVKYLRAYGFMNY